MICDLMRERILKKLSTFHCLALVIGIALLSSGCATPIGVTRVDPRTAQSELTANEDRVFALAELSFLHAENSGDRSYYLAAAASAYAFLLPGKNGTPPRAIDPRARWAVDIYNRALARGFTSDDGDHVVLKGGQFALP